MSLDNGGSLSPTGRSCPPIDRSTTSCSSSGPRSRQFGPPRFPRHTCRARTPAARGLGQADRRFDPASRSTTPNGRPTDRWRSTRLAAGPPDRAPDRHRRQTRIPRARDTARGVLLLPPSGCCRSPTHARARVPSAASMRMESSTLRRSDLRLQLAAPSAGSHFGRQERGRGRGDGRQPRQPEDSGALGGRPTTRC